MVGCYRSELGAKTIGCTSTFKLSFPVRVQLLQQIVYRYCNSDSNCNSNCKSNSNSNSNCNINCNSKNTYTAASCARKMRWWSAEVDAVCRRSQRSPVDWARFQEQLMTVLLPLVPPQALATRSSNNSSDDNSSSNNDKNSSSEQH
eukprot:TRINITY_DN26041_c0_g1_i1.p1 TRINITY_DN26041_c0_g1~~TRINITY_DN26041_c0_g1_i1.p1  ORF type:complete len:146 (-),score=25.81 TRINITY_DN26041_c0_g1_i1:132-569(-)